MDGVKQSFHRLLIVYNATECTKHEKILYPPIPGKGFENKKIVESEKKTKKNSRTNRTCAKLRQSNILFL